MRGHAAIPVARPFVTVRMMMTLADGQVKHPSGAGSYLQTPLGVVSRQSTSHSSPTFSICTRTWFL